MRICLISREYPPDTGWGGIATFANHLALGLTALGHEVEVIALAKDKAKTVEQDGVKVHRVEPHQIDGSLGAASLCMPYSCYVLRTTTALWKKFSEIHCQRPFDVVDSPELLAEGIVPAVTKAAPLLIRLYTPHSKFIAEQLHNVTNSFDHQFVAMLERIAMLNADVITSPSDDLAEYVSGDLNYPLDRIKIVRNPIDPDKFSPDGPKAIPADRSLKVLFVGRLEERKGIRYLIDAVPEVARNVPNVRFIILGDDTNNGKGQSSVMAELKETIVRNSCGQYVEFIPRVPLAELADYYRSADVCVVPSVYDNSPYTCLEAMSCGKPVIGTSSGGTREYIVHDESGMIVPPRDAESLARALVKLLREGDERKRLGNNARKRVIEKFHRDEIARQTVELYHEAQSAFARNQQVRLYRKPIAGALADADTLLYSYDKMLYDLLYLQSYRFRLKHWWTLVSKRPRLSLAKVFVKLARTWDSLSGRGSSELVRQLEEEIRVRQRRAQAESEQADSARI
jgi:glycosyltransferase involved in cell wall biosynthesis